VNTNLAGKCTFIIQKMYGFDPSQCILWLDSILMFGWLMHAKNFPMRIDKSDFVHLENKKFSISKLKLMSDPARGMKTQTW